MRIMIGTSNPGKLERTRKALEPIGYTVIAPPSVVDVDEDGDTPIENAEAKAKAYAKAFGFRVLASDEALYFDGLPDDVQPGTHVRRIPGFVGRPTDDDMLQYYMKLFNRYGGTIKGRWDFAFAVAGPDDICVSTVCRSAPRSFTSVPCSARVAGQPISSLQQVLGTGKYLAELNEAERLEFLLRTYVQPLRDFMQSVPTD